MIIARAIVLSFGAAFGVQQLQLPAGGTLMVLVFLAVLLGALLAQDHLRWNRRG